VAEGKCDWENWCLAETQIWLSDAQSPYAESDR
jgi:hypothetical protein